LIETLTSDYMRRYGYERMTEATASISQSAFDMARRTSEQARAHAWQGLERTNFRDFALRRHRAEYLAAVRTRMEQCAHARAAGNDGALEVVKLDELTAAFEVTD